MQIHPHGARDVHGTRYVLMQVWDWDGECYHTTMYAIEHPEAGEPTTRAIRSTYYAVAISTLVELLERAGFADVERIDGAFFQAVLLGRRPELA